MTVVVVVVVVPGSTPADAYAGSSGFPHRQRVIRHGSLFTDNAASKLGL
jgi:hypothetical protein